MFISNTPSLRSISRSSGENISVLNNIDYYKRYIIIEIPTFGFENPITVINISSATGRDSIGIMKNSERIQSTNVYHCKGVVFDMPMSQILDKDISNHVNVNAMITVDDVSYGEFDFDLNRQRFAELRTTTSYSDIMSDVDKFSQLPNIRFYNTPHHILNEELNNDEYPTGAMYIPVRFGELIKSVEVVRLGDIIDNHTKIMVTKESNYNKVLNSSYDDDFLRKLSILTIGPVTDFILGLMFNEMEFCYDSIDGVSRIKYKTDHILPPNNIYMSQIQSNAIAQFRDAMDYISEMTDWKFRLFVHAVIGNVRLRFINYSTHGISVSKSFEFDVGKFRNDQHFDAMKFMDHCIEL